MRRKKNILLIGQTPPPFHGQAVATKLLFDHDWNEKKVYCLRMDYSHSEVEVGRFRIRKIFHLFSLTFKSIVLLIGYKPCIIYYPPASPHIVPVLRDIFFLTFVRPFAKGTVFHFHAGGLAEYLNSLKNPLRFLARLAYSKPDVGIAISKSQMEDINAFLPKRKIVIPNGLDVPDDVTAGSKKEEGLKRILYVAGLRKSKGVLDLITTAEKLKQMKVDFIIDVVGSWQEPETEKIFLSELSQKGFEKNFLIHGKLTGQDKWKLYQSASVFFFPSYYESENFPLVLIEAMAFGLPIVSTKWRGITEMVDQGGSGFLCEIGKCDQFAEALKCLLIDKGVHDEMSKSARSLYRNKYTKHAFLNAMEKAFEDVASND